MSKLQGRKAHVGTGRTVASVTEEPIAHMLMTRIPKAKERLNRKAILHQEVDKIKKRVRAKAERTQKVRHVHQVQRMESWKMGIISHQNPNPKLEGGHHLVRKTDLRANSG